MKTNRNTEDLIDLYLLDKLSPVERKRFEDEMLKNDDLSKEVEIMQHIMAGFERKNEIEAADAMLNTSEEQIKTIIANVENNHKPPVKRTKLFVAMTAIAAGIALLLYIGFQPEYTSQELYDSFYTPLAYEYIPSRGGTLSDNKEFLLQQAIAAYNQGNYTEALNLFDSITANIDAEETTEEIKFYAALCMTKTGKEQAALEELESIAYSVDSEFKQDAQWNLALVYLKIGERNKCRQILMNIIENVDNPYTEDSNILLDKLKAKKWF